MATLALFIAAAPFRGLVKTADGLRILVRGLDEASDDGNLVPDIFIDRLGAEIGIRATRAANNNPAGLLWRANAVGIAAFEGVSASGADGAEQCWTGRDLFALVLRRAILAAERSAGQNITRLHIVTPAGLEPDDQAELIASGYLAGAAEVDLVDIGELVIDALDSDVGERHLVIQFDIEQLRVQLFRALAKGALLEQGADLSPRWSGASIVDRIVEQASPDRPVNRPIRLKIADILRQWESPGPGYALRAPTHGTPEPLFVPAEARRLIAADLIAEIERMLAAKSLSFLSIGRVHLHGDWATGLHTVFERLSPGARIELAASPAAALEFADPEVSGALRARSSIYADLPSDVRIPVKAQTRVQLLDTGQNWPWLFLDQSFPAVYLDRLALYMVEPSVADGKPLEFGCVTIPRIYERRQFSPLELRVTADDAAYLAVRIQFGLAAAPTTILLDKRSGASTVIPEYVVVALNRVNRLQARGRT